MYALTLPADHNINQLINLCLNIPVQTLSLLVYTYMYIYVYIKKAFWCLLMTSESIRIIMISQSW